MKNIYFDPILQKIYWDITLFEMSDANEIKNLLVIHLVHHDEVNDLIDN